MTSLKTATLLLCTWGTLLSCSSKSAAPSNTAGGAGSPAGNAGATNSAGGTAGSSTGTAGTTTQAGATAGGSGGSAPVAGAGGTPETGGAGGTGGSTGGAAGAGGMTAMGPPFGHPSPTATHPQYDGFTLWVVEDFDEALDLNTDPIWTWSDGGFQTHRFTQDAIGFSNGALTITLDERPQPESCSHSNYGIVPARTRTSGELRSRHNMFRYGRYETRMKAPSVQPNDPAINGNYIASLFIFRQPACQEWREIDLEITGDSANYLVTNVILATGSCAVSEMREDFDLTGVDFRTNYQTIGFEWLPGSVRYYRFDDDGMEITLRQLTDASVPDLPAKIMANLWVFNDTFAFGGPEGDNNEFPLVSEYDFIRFYKWNDDMEYPCPTPDASCLPATDTDLAGNNGCDGIDNSGDLSNCMQCGTTVHVACTAQCN